MNGEVNCKVNEFAAESVEAQILKGCVCVLVNNTKECARHWSLVAQAFIGEGLGNSIGWGQWFPFQKQESLTADQ